MMRLWHFQLLPYLPEKQFKGQLRELVAMLKDLANKGRVNHLLINQINNYARQDLYEYFDLYESYYRARYKKNLNKYREEFKIPSFRVNFYKPFEGWHNSEYLKICMTNLFEKYKYGRGNSRITEAEWARLQLGYKILTDGEFSL